MNDLVHLAIIMDGNGRWAKRQGKERSFGHKEGAKKVREITEYASKMGIKYLSLSSFLKSEVAVLKQNNIRFDVIGDMRKFSSSLQKEIQNAKEVTKHCTGLTQVLAINYGSRQDLLQGVQNLARLVEVGQLKAAEITEEMLESRLSTAGTPAPDLLIRPGGDYRISNFLLWQIAYSELQFLEILWPDFGKEDFFKCIDDYQNKERRFGKTSEQLDENI